MFSLVRHGFVTHCHRIGECATALLLMKKECYSLGALAGPTPVCVDWQPASAWWLEARGFVGVEGVVLRGEVTSQPGFDPPHRPLSVTPLTLSPPKSKRFFNCVAGSILMTWCEWLGGNVTSGVWYNDV